MRFVYAGELGGNACVDLRGRLEAYSTVNNYCQGQFESFLHYSIPHYSIVHLKVYSIPVD